MAGVGGRLRHARCGGERRSRTAPGCRPPAWRRPACGCGAAAPRDAGGGRAAQRSGAAGRRPIMPATAVFRVAVQPQHLVDRRLSAAKNWSAAERGLATSSHRRSPVRGQRRICGRCQIMSPMPGSGWMTARPSARRSDGLRDRGLGSASASYAVRMGSDQRASARPQPSSRNSQPPIGMLTKSLVEAIGQS